MESLSPQVRFNLLKTLLTPLSVGDFCLFTQALSCYYILLSAAIFPVGIPVFFMLLNTVYTLPTFAAYLTLVLIVTGVLASNGQETACLENLGMYIGYLLLLGLIVTFNPAFVTFLGIIGSFWLGFELTGGKDSTNA